eukprot:2361323-Prymnesium_polylepis.1
MPEVRRTRGARFLQVMPEGGLTPPCAGHCIYEYHGSELSKLKSAGALPHHAQGGALAACPLAPDRYGALHSEPADDPTTMSAASLSAARRSFADEAAPRRLAVFTLVRGGPSTAHYASFVASRECLRDVMPHGVLYDNVAFHEGNVPAEMQPVLRQQV